MKMKAITDGEPFDTTRSPLDLGFVRDGPAARRAHAEALQAMRRRVARWGVARGFEIVDDGLKRVAEGGEVMIGFSDTAEICTVRSTALQPTQLHLQLEPKSWTDRIGARLSRRFETADRAFDERWRIKTDNEEVAKHLLDPRVRAALIHHPIWCRVTYLNGEIELRLDSGSQRLTGAHLLAATEVAIALARATPQGPSSPYR